MANEKKQSVIAYKNLMGQDPGQGWGKKTDAALRYRTTVKRQWQFLDSD